MIRQNVFVAALAMADMGPGEDVLKAMDGDILGKGVLVGRLHR